MVSAAVMSILKLRGVYEAGAANYAVILLASVHADSRGWMRIRGTGFGLAPANHRRYTRSQRLVLNLDDILYDRVATRNLERLTALSDGVFAVAMTLLVLDLRAPARELVHSDGSLFHALIPMTPRLVMYLMSFLTIGIFWSVQQTQTNQLTHADRNLTWIHLSFLFTITFFPFSTELLGQFITLRSALLIYWFNILMAGATLYLGWHYADRAGLIKSSVSQEVRVALRRRILITQSLYAVGAALCVFDTYASIAFIVVVQLNHAIAPIGYMVAKREHRRTS
jgi:uncharacterized membrane protein